MRAFYFLSVGFVCLFFVIQGQACPPQNENFLLHEHDGEENVFVGHIDTEISQVQREHVDFVIQEVQLNDVVLCNSLVRGQACKNVVALKAGPLGEADHVRVVMRDLSSQDSKVLVFERWSSVRDVGSLCRPMWPQTSN